MLRQIGTTEQMPIEEDCGFVEEDDEEDDELENFRAFSPILERCVKNLATVFHQMMNI